MRFGRLGGSAIIIEVCGSIIGSLKLVVVSDGGIGGAGKTTFGLVGILTSSALDALE